MIRVKQKVKKLALFTLTVAREAVPHDHEFKLRYQPQQFCVLQQLITTTPFIPWENKLH